MSMRENTIHSCYKFSKQVCQYTIDMIFIRRYSSLAEAEKITGISKSSISSVCRGIMKTSRGYIWIYPPKLKINFISPDKN